MLFWIIFINTQKIIKISEDIQNYINQFPDEVQKKLLYIRKLIFDEVPEVEEHISYAMPGYYFEGKPLCYFAAYKKHIGFYATLQVHEAMQEKLKLFKQGKGSI